MKHPQIQTISIAIIQQATTMNSKTTILLVFFSFFLAPFLCARFPSEMPDILPPLIPKQAVGKYLPRLEFIEKLRKEKRFLELYEESKRIVDEIIHEWNERDKGEEETPEEIAMCHWMRYYQLSAPLFSCDFLVGSMDKISKDDFSSACVRDWAIKIDACEFFCRDDPLDVVQMFSLDKKAYLRRQVENLSKSISFFRRLYLYTYDTKLHAEEDLPLRKRIGVAGHEYIEGLKKQGISGFSNLGPEVWRLEFYLDSLRDRRLSIQNAVGSLTHELIKGYIRHLVECFPNQGRLVQNYVRKTGLCNERGWDPREPDAFSKSFEMKNPHFYSEDLKLSIELGLALERKNGYEWAWVGLPPLAKAQKLMFEHIEKFNEESRRQSAISDRLEAEAAAKKAAKAAKARAEREAKMRAAEAEAVRIKNAQDAAKTNAQESAREISTASPLEKSGNPGSEKTDSPKADNGGAEDSQTKNDAVKSPSLPQEGAAKKK
jgi:hypothetical protein